MTNCKKCGHKNKSEAQFCVKCGHGLVQNKKADFVSRKKFILYLVIFITAIIFLVAFSWWQANQRNTLISERTELNAQIDGLKNEVITKEGTINELQSQTSTLQSQAQSSESQLREVQQSALQTQSNVEETKKELQDIVSSLNNLESWVSQNAKLPSDTFNLVSQMCKHSITKTGDKCIIDANAMGAKMRSCLGFTWVDDTTTSNFNSGDVIYDTATFFNSKKGDCDDFAFFYTAWIRSEYEYAKTLCTEDKISIKFSSSLSLVCPCEVYEVCGGLKSGGGHCETGVTTKSNSPNNPSTFLNNLYIIEPQSGSYDGLTFNQFETIWEYFTPNDFITVSNNNAIISSIQFAKQKANAITL